MNMTRKSQFPLGFIYVLLSSDNVGNYNFEWSLQTKKQICIQASYLYISGLQDCR